MGQKLGALALTLVAGGGCKTATIPYDYGRVEARAAARHPLRVAVLPLEDAREPGDHDHDDDRFMYRGLEYRGTRLEELRAAHSELSEIIARHLVRARTFAQMILVNDPEQAPEADLFLTGRVRRMRGYVEAEPPDEKSGRPADERYVLSEVLIEDVRLTTREGERRLDVDIGWSVYEARRAETPPEPWAILAETLGTAVAQLESALDGAALDGSFVVTPKVALAAATATTSTFGRLADAPPATWVAAAESEASAPVGWRADPACEALALTQKQTQRFHRALGPYQPRVRVWACPASLALRYDTKVEFPAKYLGTRPGGHRYFAWRVGESNWPGADDEIRAHLGAVAPADKYVFELGP